MHVVPSVVVAFQCMLRSKGNNWNLCKLHSYCYACL